MRDKWLEEYSPGEFQISGIVTSKDRTVITPQADVNYGYSWFNISKEPVVIKMPAYDKYYSLTVFDMNHFIEVFVMPDKPIVVRLASQKSPIERCTRSCSEKPMRGWHLTRQVVVDNEAEVLKLSKDITISGGHGNQAFYSSFVY